MKIDYVNYLNESMETLSLAIRAYQKAIADKGAIKQAYEARTAAQRHFAEDRKKTLVEITNDMTKTATVRAMAQAEIDDMENSAFPPTPSEEKAYQAAHTAINEAIEEIQKSKEEAKLALKAVEKEIERDKATIFSENSNVQWLERMLQNDKGLIA